MRHAGVFSIAGQKRIGEHVIQSDRHLSVTALAFPDLLQLYVP